MTIARILKLSHPVDPKKRIQASKNGKPVSPADHALSRSPLPPDGLPAGWTMEQWAWYGEDYLQNR